MFLLLLVFDGSFLEGDGFTELYFSNPELPVRMTVNNSHTVNFTVVSHEKRDVHYIYSISFDKENISGDFSLSPGETKNISVEVKPVSESWNLYKVRSREWTDTIELAKETYLIERSLLTDDYNTLAKWLNPAQSESLSNTLNNQNQQVLYPDTLEGYESYQNILNSNISLNELEKAPLKRNYEYLDVTDEHKIESLELIELSREGRYLKINRKITASMYNRTTKTLTVTLKPENDDEFQIYFNYLIYGKT